MSTPRKFCWIYENLQTGNFERVQRPRRRVINGVYRVRVWVTRRYSDLLTVREYTYKEFRKLYKFVGRQHYGSKY